VAFLWVAWRSLWLVVTGECFFAALNWHISPHVKKRHL